MTDYCAECGNPLRVLDHGASERCCHGAGYWSDAGIAPRDAWAAHEMARHEGLRLFVRKLGYKLIFPRTP